MVMGFIVCHILGYIHAIRPHAAAKTQQETRP